MSTNSENETDPVSENEPRTIFGSHLPLERENAWFILVSVLDILLTYKLLSGGKIVEANPIARFFIDRWGAKGMVFYKMGMVAFITVLAQLIATKNTNAARWVLLFGIIVSAIVVVYSVSLLVKFGGV